MSEEDDLRHDIADVLRLSGRKAMKYEDGEYFDSTVFDAQARAVMELLKGWPHGKLST